MCVTLLVLSGCGKEETAAPEPENEKTVETTPEKEPEPTPEPKKAQLADGIIPYLEGVTIHLEYDEFNSADQQADQTVNRLYTIEPLLKEGDLYASILKTFSGAELSEGELYYVTSLKETAGMDTIELSSEQLKKAWPSIKYFWIMKDDPQNKLLTIKAFRGYGEESADGTVVYDFYAYEEYRNAERYVIDYSGMDNDDWKATVCTDMDLTDKRQYDVFTFPGYMTAYEPAEGIPPYQLISVNTEGLRIRSTPEIKDDNIIGKIVPEDKDLYFLTYLVYEKQENDGYTWYRIGKRRWIASNGEWISEEGTD